MDFCLGQAVIHRVTGAGRVKFLAWAANRARPSALFLSTMIPCLVNLVIGGTSLVRGLPGRAVPTPAVHPRTWWRPQMEPALDRHCPDGSGRRRRGPGHCAAQVFLVWVIIGYVMPFFGLELFDMSRDVAASNLPPRVGQLFGVCL